MIVCQRHLYQTTLAFFEFDSHPCRIKLYDHFETRRFVHSSMSTGGVGTESGYSQIVSGRICPMASLATTFMGLRKPIQGVREGPRLTATLIKCDP